MMKKRVIALFISICLFESLLVTGYGNTENRIREGAELFALEQILLCSEIEEFSANWSEDTIITASVELYVPNGTLTGFIFDFDTDDVPSGFIQVGCNSDEYYVVNLGFTGNNYLLEMINIYNHNAKTPIDKDQLMNNTVYYIGGFDYFLYDSNGSIVDLSNGTLFDGDMYDLQECYDQYSFKMAHSFDEADDIEGVDTNIPMRASTKVVNNFGTANTHMKNMEYYSGYSNHCSPTAAANIVMYWKYGRSFFSGNSSSITSVFIKFYNYMQTNQGGAGTSYSNIKPAYDWYFNQYSGANTNNIGYTTSVTFNKIKTKINDNIPLHLSITNYSGGAHAVNVWGYSINGSTNYLSITNNWSNVNTSLINYNSYSYNRYTYCDISN